jgi:hypothetical protein
VILLVVAAACVGGRPETPAPPVREDPLADAVRTLAAGDFAGGTAGLERLAASCESGVAGRRAVLLLATTALDPRNPAASPDRGAELAARYLTLPGIDTTERVVGETLFLLAIGEGGRVPGVMPGRDTASSAMPADSVAVPPDTAGPTTPPVASRFQRCGGGAVPVAAVDTTVLPSLSDSLYRRLPAVQRDSLAARVATLEAELQRIRVLLQEGLLPDTSDPGGRP